MALISKGTPYGSGIQQLLWIGPAAYYDKDSILLRGAYDDDAAYSGHPLFDGGQSPPLNQWAFLGGSYEHATPYNKLHLIINDWTLDAFWEPDFDPNTGNSLPIRIGIDSSSSNPYTGQAAKFWIINDVLTAADLLHIYNLQKYSFGYD